MMFLEYIANFIVLLATASTLACRMRDYHRQNEVSSFKKSSLGPSIDVFFRQVDLLEDASLNYFNTLNDAGLKDLIVIREQLKAVMHDRDNLIKLGKNDDANLLADFLNSPNPKPYRKLYELTNAKLEKLDNWKDLAQNRIMNCVIQLGISSNRPTSAHSQQAQLTRANRRRATFCTLNELKEIITDQRVS